MRILAVGAHLDDIEIACGATIAKAIQNGHDVKCLIMSKSGYTNLEGGMQRQNDIAVREGSEALRALGVQDFEILDFPTKDIQYCSNVIGEIEKRIVSFRPDIIFTHHPFDTHQAHVGVSNSTISAARRKNTIFFFEPLAPSGRSYVAFHPQLYVDVESTFETKIRALKKHESEYNKFGGEDWIKGVESRCVFRGYEISKKYAEAFEVLRCEISFSKETLL